MNDITELENLSFINFLKIYDVLLDIEEDYELNHNDYVILPVFPRSLRFPELYPNGHDIEPARKDALHYLEKRGVLLKLYYMADWETSEPSIEVTLIIPKLQEFLVRAKKQYKVTANKQMINQEGKQSKLIDEKDVVYEITYTSGREILLNRNFILSKPDFDSENDLVFNYLYKNPNIKISKDVLEKAIDKKLIKLPNKIIENLGFQGDLRKVFFNVGKNTIFFRNPISRHDLQELGLDRIKLPR